jgi:hypothetical protein
LTNVSISDAGTYSVIVSGTCNSVTNSATLSLNTAISSTGLTSILNNCLHRISVRQWAFDFRLEKERQRDQRPNDQFLRHCVDGDQ